MIEKDDLLVHLDPACDRVGNADFKFTGWVAAHQAIRAVSLPKAGPHCLTTCERPDVRRVFPDRVALGFSGRCPASALGQNGLRIAVEVENGRIEVEHPVPAALPQPSFAAQWRTGLRMSWLRLREKLASHDSARFEWMLRRHLLARRLRGGVFHRRHTESLLQDFATAIPDAFFLQIGANDGFTGDPLNPMIERSDTRWRGVLVEPVAHLFTKLAERHAKNPALRLEQAAIGERDGRTIMHRVASTQADSLWLDQIPSLDPELLRRSAAQFGSGERATIAEEVPMLSVATLLERHAIARLDLLVIDTEGYDWRILRQFDLTRLRPKLILYEHQHLSPEENASARRFLDQEGYESVATEEGDTIAWPHLASSKSFAQRSQASS
jgi:FkbM family methyltransferase